MSSEVLFQEGRSLALAPAVLRRKRVDRLGIGWEEERGVPRRVVDSYTIEDLVDVVPVQPASVLEAPPGFRRSGRPHVWVVLKCRGGHAANCSDEQEAGSAARCALRAFLVFLELSVSACD